jgi:excisionase family DNA binding protein
MGTWRANAARQVCGGVGGTTAAVERVSDLPLTLKVEEAARLLGIGRGSAYEAARRGEIPTIRLGRRVLVPRAKLLELLGESSPYMREPDLSRAQDSRENELGQRTQ